MSNLCRDEITATLKTKLDTIFGSSFNTNGLGGVLTCGVTGVKAGLSHSPISLVSSHQFIALPKTALPNKSRNACCQVQRSMQMRAFVLASFTVALGCTGPAQ